MTAIFMTIAGKSLVECGGKRDGAAPFHIKTSGTMRRKQRFSRPINRVVFLTRRKPKTYNRQSKRMKLKNL